jgi:hypothetical protein
MSTCEQQCVQLCTSHSTRRQLLEVSDFSDVLAQFFNFTNTKVDRVQDGIADIGDGIVDIGEGVLNSTTTMINTFELKLAAFEASMGGKLVNISRDLGENFDVLKTSIGDHLVSFVFSIILAVAIVIGTMLAGAILYCCWYKKKGCCCCKTPPPTKPNDKGQ